MTERHRPGVRPITACADVADWLEPDTSERAAACWKR
jgi:hypothetical protein